MTRGDGPLPLSEELKKALWHCERVLASGILGPEARSWHHGDGRLRAESVAYVEEQIGFHLPLEVLSLLAVGHPVAGLVTGLRGLESILDATEEPVELRGVQNIDGAEGREWTCVARVYHEPIQEVVTGAHGGAYLELLVEASSKECPLPVLVAEGGYAEELTTLPELIVETIREELKRLGAKGPIGEAAEVLSRYAPPTPELVVDTETSTAQSGRVASHKKFGTGTVRSIEGAGPEARVTIEFEGVGTKVILGRFLSGL